MNEPNDATRLATAVPAANETASAAATAVERPAHAGPERRSPSSVPPMAMDEIGELARQVRVGLLKRPRTLPMKWMFDEVGASLYEAWTQLPECGLTRAESRVLDRNAQRIADMLHPTTTVVELGPTTGRRKRKLLELLGLRAPVSYTAIEITPTMQRRCLFGIDDIPGVRVEAIEGSVAALAGVVTGAQLAGSSFQPTTTAEHTRTGATLVMWLGAGIGAYEPPAAEAAFTAIRSQLVPGDALLLGTDLLKHESVLLRAYDDQAGIAAAFNRSYLARICRELGGELDVRQFRHEARWNEAARRIELHLVATQQVNAKINAAGIVVHMEIGESIYTACAHKALPHEPGLLGARTGFAAAGQWLDPTWPYAATLFIAQ